MWAAQGEGEPSRGVTVGCQPVERSAVRHDSSVDTVGPAIRCPPRAVGPIGRGSL